MSNRYNNIEDRIWEVVKSLNIQKKPNIAKTACNFCILLLKLKNCWNDWQLKSQMVAYIKTVSEVQKLAIRQYLDYLDWERQKIKYNQLEQVVNAFFKNNYTGRDKPLIVGLYWAGQFS